MKFNPDGKAGKVLGKMLSVAIVAGAIALGLVVLYLANRYPRTDDSEIVANFIGIAPQVEGPILHLNVRDNQFVKRGDLLFEIDDRPYRYALERALSEQASLEGQIVDETRRIAALVSAVSVSQANIQGTEADVNRSQATIDQAQADVANAGQGVSRARAEWAYANSNLHRIEPLLAKQFVTADQVDRARTFEIAQAQALKQAESQLRLAQAGLQSAIAQRERSLAMVEQSKAQHQQTPACRDHPGAPGHAARRESRRREERPLQPGQLPRIFAVRSPGDQSDDLGRRLRTYRPADIHSD